MNIKVEWKDIKPIPKKVSVHAELPRRCGHWRRKIRRNNKTVINLKFFHNLLLLFTGYLNRFLAVKVFFFYKQFLFHNILLLFAKVWLKWHFKVCIKTSFFQILKCYHFSNHPLLHNEIPNTQTDAFPPKSSSLRLSFLAETHQFVYY